jgi:hypothetical protein
MMAVAAVVAAAAGAEAARGNAVFQAVELESTLLFRFLGTHGLSPILDCGRLDENVFDAAGSDASLARALGRSLVKS